MLYYIKLLLKLQMKSIFDFLFNIYNQIKMFMNQMSVSGLDQITAFEFFNANLDIVRSVSNFSIVFIFHIITMYILHV